MASNYAKWLKPFAKFKPMLLNVEEMSKNPNFPNANRTADVKYKNDIVPPFSDQYRKLTEDLLKLEIAGNFWEGDHETGVPTREAQEILKPFNPGEIRRNDYRERA